MICSVGEELGDSPQKPKQMSYSFWYILIYMDWIYCIKVLKSFSVKM